MSSVLAVVAQPGSPARSGCGTSGLLSMALLRALRAAALGLLMLAVADPIAAPPANAGAAEATIETTDRDTVRLQIEQRLHHDSDVLAVAWSRDGKLIATLSDFYTRAMVWNVGTGEKICEFRVVEAHSIAFTPDGNHLVTGSAATQPHDDTAVTVWDIPSRQIIARAQGAEPGKDAIYNAAARFALSPDGNLMAVFGIQVPNTVWLYDAKNWTRIGRLPLINPGSMVFSPDGRELAVATLDLIPPKPADIGRDMRDTLRFFDVSTRTQKREITVYEHEAPSIEALAYRPDGAVIATGAEHSFSSIADAKGVLHTVVPPDSVILWDAKTGTQLRSFPGNFAVERTLSWGAQGRLLASADGDGKIRLRSPESAQPVAMIATGAAPAYSVAFSADGSKLAYTDRRELVIADLAP